MGYQGHPAAPGVDDFLAKIAALEGRQRSTFPSEQGNARPGAPTALAKVTGMIMTARVRLRVTAGCEAPPLRPAQRNLSGV